ncbi:MAG: ABC transporter permease [Myxococcota bacterium]|nr:ABC transporter permease [Myxococcota bacterium]
MAARVLRRHPGRTLLTVLGLAIGVGAFIAMVSFAEGARRSVVRQFETLGTNLLRVRPGSRARAEGVRPAMPLSDADVRLLRREATTLALVVPVARRTLAVTTEAGRVHRTRVDGTEPDYARIAGLRFAAGGMFDATDLGTSNRVCVLGVTVARALFGERDPLGERVRIGPALPARVVGVVAAQGRTTTGSDLDDFVLVPRTTFALFLGATEGYSSLEVRPRSAALFEAARHELTTLLRRSHGLGPAEPDDFTLWSPEDTIRAAEETSRILGALLAAIAAISLLVGGIGIMNIQLVSVSERTHEIGIRAAIGGSPAQILRQFLAEALLLALVGATAGVLLGVGSSWIVAHAMQWPPSVSWRVVALSAGFGTVVGVLFGYVPARRAARLDPIVALRRE